MFRIIASESKWLAVRNLDVGFHTPFNRLKRNWVTVYPASISDSTDRIHSWSPDGDIITLITTHDGPMDIHLNKIKPAVDSLFKDLAATLATLLPSQMGNQLPLEPKWEIQDNLTATIPFVDQDTFLSMISPLYIQFSTSMRSSEESDHQIWSDDGFQTEKFEEWLKLEQKVLQKIFLILLFTGGGISPRTFSIAALQYRNSPEKRNLYLHHGFLCFAWPKAKANSQSNLNSSSDSLYSYPIQLNWLLFIYLGIIRRFTVEVMEELKWSLGDMKNKLFVYSGMKKNRGFSWEAALMNDILGDFSKNIFGSCPRVADFRQLTQSIYSLHFCKREEMVDIMEATANKMGNHTKDVSKRYYNRNNRIIEGFDTCFACSQAWHCWLGLLPYNSTIKTQLGELPILQRRRNQDLASLKSKMWIRVHKPEQFTVVNIGGLLARLLSQVSLDTSVSYEGLTSPTRNNLNMTYFAKPLHLYSGVEKMHHF